MALELVDITEDDIADILFMRAPPRVPLVRLRLKLELAVKKIWDEDIAEIQREHPNWRPDSDDKPVLSPGTIWRALRDPGFDKKMQMSVGDLAKSVHGKYEGRPYAAAMEKNDCLARIGYDTKLADVGRSVAADEKS